MTEDQATGWLALKSADRSGTRILVTVRGSEQGPPEVDTVRWDRPRNAHEHCWVATDSGPDAPVTYEDDDLVAWMPLPTPTMNRGAYSGSAVKPAREIDFLEQSGSGI